MLDDAGARAVSADVFVGNAAPLTGPDDAAVYDAIEHTSASPFTPWPSRWRSAALRAAAVENALAVEPLAYTLPSERDRFRAACAQEAPEAWAVAVAVVLEALSDPAAVPNSATPTRPGTRQESTPQAVGCFALVWRRLGGALACGGARAAQEAALCLAAPEADADTFLARLLSGALRPHTPRDALRLAAGVLLHGGSSPEAAVAALLELSCWVSSRESAVGSRLAVGVGRVAAALTARAALMAHLSDRQVASSALAVLAAFSEFPASAFPDEGLGTLPRAGQWLGPTAGILVADAIAEHASSPQVAAHGVAALAALLGAMRTINGSPTYELANRESTSSDVGVRGNGSTSSKPPPVDAWLLSGLLAYSLHGVVLASRAAALGQMPEPLGSSTLEHASRLVAHALGRAVLSKQLPCRRLLQLGTAAAEVADGIAASGPITAADELVLRPLATCAVEATLAGFRFPLLGTPPLVTDDADNLSSSHALTARVAQAMRRLPQRIYVDEDTDVASMEANGYFVAAGSAPLVTCQVAEVKPTAETAVSSQNSILPQPMTPELSGDVLQSWILLVTADSHSVAAAAAAATSKTLCGASAVEARISGSEALRVQHLEPITVKTLHQASYCCASSAEVFVLFCSTVTMAAPFVEEIAGAGSGSLARMLIAVFAGAMVHYTTRKTLQAAAIAAAAIMEIRVPSACCIAGLWYARFAFCSAMDDASTVAAASSIFASLFRCQELSTTPAAGDARAVVAALNMHPHKRCVQAAGVVALDVLIEVCFMEDMSDAAIPAEYKSADVLPAQLASWVSIGLPGASAATVLFCLRRALLKRKEGSRTTDTTVRLTLRCLENLLRWVKLAITTAAHAEQASLGDVVMAAADACTACNVAGEDASHALERALAELLECDAGLALAAACSALDVALAAAARAGYRTRAADEAAVVAAAAVRTAAAAESRLSRASSMVAAPPDDGSTASLIAALLQAQEELAARVRKLEETGNME